MDGRWHHSLAAVGFHGISATPAIHPAWRHVLCCFCLTPNLFALLQTIMRSFLGVGAPEAILVAVVALVVFGPKGLADVSNGPGLLTTAPTCVCRAYTHSLHNCLAAGRPCCSSATKTPAGAAACQQLAMAHSSGGAGCGVHML